MDNIVIVRALFTAVIVVIAVAYRYRIRASIKGSRVSTAILAVGLVVAQWSVATTDVAQAQAVTQAHAESGKYQAYQRWRHPVGQALSIGDRHDTLLAYAEKCNDATEIRVPSFSCSAGTEVPGQGTVPATVQNATHCDQPNVLNAKCDPGSKFQVLSGGTEDAVAVAHCRKDGLKIDGDLYNDIAVIQYNKKNGAVCFYQALTNLPGEDIPSPSDRGTAPSARDDPNLEGAAWKDGLAYWINPTGTEAIGCTGCHDNGGFIRSRYLAQLEQLNPRGHVLPNVSSGFNNLNTPLRYVGLDYATNRSWEVMVSTNAPGDTGSPCTSCHRLAVPNRPAFGLMPNGTAAHFANVSTAETQVSKYPHGRASMSPPRSPIWMRPTQIDYDSKVEATATKFHNCAVGFWNSGFVTAPPGCLIRPLGEPFVEPPDDPLRDIILGTYRSTFHRLPTDAEYSEALAYLQGGGTQQGLKGRLIAPFVPILR